MALIALASAQGSPGVSTTALGLALAWPRGCLLVDADPSGAAAWLAGYFRGAAPEVSGLVGLASHPIVEQIDRGLPGASLRIQGTEARVLPGVASRQQGGAMGPLWAPLAQSLRKLDTTGQDVLVDAGRLGLAGAPMPLLEAADLTLLVVRSHLPALVGAREWAAELPALVQPVHGHPRVGLLVVGPGRPYRAKVVTDTLGVPVVSELPFDPDNAAVLSEGNKPDQYWDRSSLVRGLWNAAQAVHKTAAQNRAAGGAPREGTAS